MSSQSQSSASGGGIGLTTLLTVSFVVLRLCRVIDWSWWWVTFPTWGTFVLCMMIIVLWAVVSVWRETK